MKDLLTIVIPCKNEENYIVPLLEDLSQQYGISGVRIIIADANSTDATVPLINTYKDKLNIEVIEGGPVSVGRNNGAALATTPYILFLDADVRLFNKLTIFDAVHMIDFHQLDLVTANIKNYGMDWRASFFFGAFNIINQIMTKKTPFAIGAFFLTRRDRFEELGGFPEKTVTSEDYFLSRMYSPKKFKIVSHYFGQDSRRFKKMGYFGMAAYLIKNFINRNNKEYWDRLDSSKYWN